MSKPSLYGATIKVSSELELYKSLLFQYSVQRFMRGENPFVLREQLLTLLALYFQYGYSKETKELACQVLGVDANTITSFNFNLKEKQYLVEDRINKGLSTSTKI